jgi:hypothetical protein
MGAVGSGEGVGEGAGSESKTEHPARRPAAKANVSKRQTMGLMHPIIPDETTAKTLIEIL